MKHYVTDTYSALWFLTGNKRLSRRVRTAFQRAQAGFERIAVPSIVLVEAVLLWQRQRISKEIVQILLDLPEDPTAGIYVVPLTVDIVRKFAEFGPAAIPDMPDRIIAATAMYLNLPLLTADPDIEESGLVKTIW